jgi:hypothetical protein
LDSPLLRIEAVEWIKAGTLVTKTLNKWFLRSGPAAAPWPVELEGFMRLMCSGGYRSRIDKAMAGDYNAE